MSLVATTWDVFNKASGWTLSGGNLTAAITSATGVVRANRSAAGDIYFEIVPNSGTPRVGLFQGNVNNGTAPGAGNLGNQLGSDNYGVGWNSGGTVTANNVTIATIATWAATNTLCVAYSPSRQRVWFRVGSGNWNNDVIGNQNPNGYVGGIDLSTLSASNNLAPAIGTSAASANVTATFAASFAQTPPTGYVGISSVSIIAKNKVQNEQSIAHGPTVGVKRVGPTSIGGGMFTPGNAGSPLGMATQISGNIQENGVNVAKTVRAYDNNTGQLIDSTVSNASTGNYTIHTRGRNQVVVVAFDPTSYQAQVYDRVTPA